MFNNQNDLYMLPSDNQEFERLQKQHYAFVLTAGGLTPCQDLVESILRPSDNGEPRSVLDLGTLFPFTSAPLTPSKAVAPVSGPLRWLESIQMPRLWR